MKRVIRIPLRANGLPALTARQLDALGEAVIRDFDPAAARSPRPVDPEALAEQYLGLTLDYLHLSCNGSILGATVFETTDALPFYDDTADCASLTHAVADTVIVESDLLRDRCAHRYRFTLAHECAHAMVHREYFTQLERDLYACTARDIMGIPDTELQLPEWQANRIASAMLMPRTSVFRLMDGADLRCRDPREQIEMVKLMRRVYDVSEAAASIRLRDLGYPVSKNDIRTLKTIYASPFLFPKPVHDDI